MNLKIEYVCLIKLTTNHMHQQILKWVVNNNQRLNQEAGG